jgi:hypothetical protein
LVATFKRTSPSRDSKGEPDIRDGVVRGGELWTALDE